MMHMIHMIHRPTSLATSLVFTLTPLALAQVAPTPLHLCELHHADLPEGATPPRFDTANWSTFTPRKGVTFSLTFENPAGPIAPFIPAIQSNLGAACARWAQNLDGACSLEVLVRIAPVPRATGASQTSVFIGAINNINVFEQSSAAEVRTGVDPNGATPDVIIQLGLDYLQNELWFDPDPATRTTPVPTNRTDAISVFIHELGHVFAFNGWRDAFNGSLPGNYMSPYDQFTTFNTNFFFNGADSVAAYGSPVPLTYGNVFHVGNNLPRPGSDLIPELMNGVVFYRGVRYDIGDLTLDISRDVGVQLTPQAPACDSIDFNNDTGFFDPQDIEALLSVFSEGPCIPESAACNDIDFNNDGGLFDPCDIQSFLTLFSEGPCTPCGL